MSDQSRPLIWRGVAVCFIAGWMLGLSGCDKPEDIHVYTVPKPSLIPLPDSPDNDPNASSADGQSAEAKPTEILGAIMPHGDTTWYFKFTGAPAAVAAVKEDFAKFVHSIRIGKTGPDWTLPAGWQASAGSEMRFATIRVATEAGKLEMSVIPLPTGPDSLDSQLLANVNRWRDQVSLGALSAEQLADSKEIAKFELNGESVWVADFIGKSQGNSMAGGMGPAHSRDADPPDTKPLPFDCQVPESWKRGRAGSFQMALFQIQENGRKGEVTISAAGGDLVANINRWREQVNLPLASDAEIEKESQKISVDGNQGILVELLDPATDAKRKGILGVIVTAQGQQWFIKFTGNAELATQVKPQFETFVKSIKFR